MAESKRYDRAYFHRWYRDPRTRVVDAESLERKVRLAVSAAEFLLGRRIRRVLDVGCGEANWYRVLRRLRRDVEYVGVDPSDYVVATLGPTLGVRQASFGELAGLRLRKGFDLIVCADALQYVSDQELRPGLREIARLLRGVAYIDVYTEDDDMEGDMDGWLMRPAEFFCRAFRSAGLVSCGLNCFINPDVMVQVNEFEIGVR